MGGIETKLINDDCRQALKTLPASSFDLIFTSPPYADTGQTLTAE
jgi:DNA modification methylase